MADSRKNKDPVGSPEVKKDGSPENEDRKKDDINSAHGSVSSAAEASPSDSPRDKRARIEGARSISPGLARRDLGAQMMVSASPPKFVSFEEIMKAADGVTNMTLAHDIAVDNEFRFQKIERPSDSLESRVREVMHQAFWDVLKESLSEDPPDYSQALKLLQEVKENLLDLLLPHNQRIRSQINEILDLDLIEQKAEHGALDMHYYSDYVLSVMAQICSPARDEDIAKLKTVKDIVPLFKSIFQVLDAMKMDMANFTIQQMRPYIQHKSVEYERHKFEQLLQQQKENNLDGLEYTKAWLQRATGVVEEKKSPQASAPASQQPQPATSATTTHQGESASGSTHEKAGGATGLSPAAILNTAYLELVSWPEGQVYPETALLDRSRFQDLQEKLEWLTLVSSVLLITYNTVGGAIAGIAELKKKLKEHIAIILEGHMSNRDVSPVIQNVAEQVNKEVSSSLEQHGFPQMSPERQESLKGQIQAVSSPEHAVYKLMKSRLSSSMFGLICQARPTEMQVPSGFSAVSEELSHVYGQFFRLISHNRSVYGAYYADILGSILQARTLDSDGGSS